MLSDTCDRQEKFDTVLWSAQQLSQDFYFIDKQEHILPSLFTKYYLESHECARSGIKPPSQSRMEPGNPNLGRLQVCQPAAANAVMEHFGCKVRVWR